MRDDFLEEKLYQVNALSFPFGDVEAELRDKDLFHHVITRNELAIQHWMGKWFDSNKMCLKFFAMGLLNGSGLSDRAEDVVMDTMVKIWTTLDTYKGGKFSALVFTALRNQCIDEMRHEEREARKTELYGLLEEPIHLTEYGLAIFESQLTMLQEALQCLTDDERATIAAFYFEGMRESEVAQKTGSTPDAVSSRKHRAIRKLRKRFGK